MYGTSQATHTDMQALGIPAAAAGCFEQPPVQVWPEHWPALELFLALGTQWRTGYGGASGLDYSVLPAVFDLYAVPTDERRDRFAEIRTMEREALNAMSSRTKRRK